MDIVDELFKWWVERGKKGISACEFMYHNEHKPFGTIPSKEFRKLIKSFRYDNELIAENVKYKQQTQKFQDTNRIERKAFRENARIYNALEDYNENLIQLLSKYNLSKIKPTITTCNNKSVGLIQLTDLHFNELINIDNNKYDFKVASKRLKLLYERASTLFKAKSITNVVVAITGDLMNSDRRLDELLNQATNRAKATMLGFYLLEQFLADLLKDFRCYVVGVTGNESRANPELGFADIMASDNYDFTIFNFLKTAFKKNQDITFGTCEKMEQVINVANQNILLMHGLSVKADIEKSIQQQIGKYASKGVIIDYVIIGHIHSCRIGDFYCRGSSMCGANAYSDYGLGLSSRASQNIGIFYDNKSHDIMKIDLQQTDDVVGYDIENELEEYNTKSVDKCKKSQTIFRVIV